MICKIADNIISPLGETTAQNYRAVKAGSTQLRRYERYEGIPEPFVASFLTAEQWQRLAVEGMTRFESLAFQSAYKAMQEAGIVPATSKTVFILSTTKGNIELLGREKGEGDAAQHIATALGIKTPPFTVCNACISGVSALILAMRLLESGNYDNAVVCGADILTPFTISGFQSLKALSAEPCRPFDIQRTGLNLGEAAATICLQRGTDGYAFLAGAIRNDAFHISSPSKNGEGARLALEAVCPDVASLLPKVAQSPQQLAFLNAHGTATMFNDQMESVAIQRAGLSSLPVNALKGYFGHTLGAAGILETVLSMAAVDDHTVLGTKGYAERGVSGHIKLTAENSQTDCQGFVKMISGFGGCNAAILVSKDSLLPHPSSDESRGHGGTGARGHENTPATDMSRTSLLPPSSLLLPRNTHTVLLTPTKAIADGQEIACEGEGVSILTDLYKRYVVDYPKYYKMDPLCRLGFVASELLLNAEGDRRDVPRTDRAVILFNHSSSIQADLSYLASIQDADNYFPSPSAFVYTLPNIVTGEIAIRNHYQGETSFYILPQKNQSQIQQVIMASFADPATQSMICGWLDYQDDAHFEAEMMIVLSSRV